MAFDFKKEYKEFYLPPERPDIILKYGLKKSDADLSALRCSKKTESSTKFL